ncbi:hypothetical protein RYH80_03450 [Halobaculum sp. MBLA0147]|uniref:hypothetical protein n=1 Tax=Halobaculum sp. MBLA0147 TaxID=3079934 RepID=UPI003526708B
MEEKAEGEMPLTLADVVDDVNTYTDFTSENGEVGQQQSDGTANGSGNAMTSVEAQPSGSGVQTDGQDGTDPESQTVQDQQSDDETRGDNQDVKSDVITTLQEYRGDEGEKLIDQLLAIKDELAPVGDAVQSVRRRKHASKAHRRRLRLSLTLLAIGGFASSITLLPVVRRLLTQVSTVLPGWIDAVAQWGFVLFVLFVAGLRGLLGWHHYKIRSILDRQDIDRQDVDRQDILRQDIE